MRLTPAIKEKLKHTQLRRWTNEELHKMSNSSKTGSKLLYRIIKEQEKRGLLVETIESAQKRTGMYPKEK